MARYIQNAHMGSISPDEYADFRTIFHGASEAPRVHGMLGDKFDRLPRFKNHYFVAFQYTDLNKSQANPKMMIDVVHRIKSVDAPKFEIETETLNQYNKPRIIPTKITYQPITITFHDDKSNYTTNFWRRIYQFYFLNGQRLSESQYSTRDSDIVIDDGQKADYNYNNYGYYIDNKLNKRNLFYSMSLYMLQNRMCTRMDLINPFLQSMQHDQFSQELSSELAQNTTMWGYENVVYYNSRSMDNDQTLRAYNYSEGDPAIFQSSPKNLDPDGQPYRETYAHTATGGSTAPDGDLGDFNDAGFSDGPGSEPEPFGGFDYSTSAQPQYTMATKPPETGFVPKSGIAWEYSEEMLKLATGLNEMLNPLELEAWAKANSDDTSQAVDEFGNLAAIESATDARNTKNSDEQRKAAMDAKVQAGEATKFEAHPKADPFVLQADPGMDDTLGEEDETVTTGGLNPGTKSWSELTPAEKQASYDRRKAALSGKKDWANLSPAEKQASYNRRQKALDAAKANPQDKNPAKWTDPTSGKVYVVSTGNNKGGTPANFQQTAIDNYWAMSPAEQNAADLARAQRKQAREDNADG